MSALRQFKHFPWDNWQKVAENPWRRVYKHPTNVELSHAVDLFVAKYPDLKDCLFADQGIRLMHIDSKIA